MPIEGTEWTALENGSTTSPVILKHVFQHQSLPNSRVLSERLCSVNVPGRIEGTGSGVVAALGGISKIAESFEDPTEVPLILRMDPNDVYSKFVPARTSRTAGVILRVRRYKSGRQEMRVEGYVEQDFSFSALADYYLAPPEVARYPGDAISELERLKANKPVPRPATMPLAAKALDAKNASAAPSDAGTDLSFAFDPYTECVLPPVFTRQFHPFPYKFQDNMFIGSAKYFMIQGGAENREDLVDIWGKEELSNNTGNAEQLTLLHHPFAPMERGLQGPHNMKARFEDKQLPCEPAMNIRGVPDTDLSLLREVEALFAQRPLWQRVALLDQLSVHVTIWRIKPALAKACFLFQDGPWRGCLCRMGYDPRKDPEARKYQTIDFRDPIFRSVTWRAQKAVSAAIVADPNRPLLDLDASDSATPTSAALQAGRGPSGGMAPRPGRTAASTEWKFLEPPSRPSQFYQLCDIEDDMVQRVLEKTPPSNVCTKAYGWCTAELMSHIRDFLCAKSRVMRQQQKQNAAALNSGSNSRMGTALGGPAA